MTEEKTLAEEIRRPFGDKWETPKIGPRLAGIMLRLMLRDAIYLRDAAIRGTKDEDERQRYRMKYREIHETAQAIIEDCEWGIT